jgi:hypothetical protein
MQYVVLPAVPSIWLSEQPPIMGFLLGSRVQALAAALADGDRQRVRELARRHPAAAQAMAPLLSERAQRERDAALLRAVEQQGLAVGATRLRPQLLSAAAAWTRIPEGALDRLRPAPVRPGTAGNTLPSDRTSDYPA